MMQRRDFYRRTLFASILSIPLLCSPFTAFGQSDDEKRAAMNAAYRQYQELVAQGPQFREQSVEPARQAYELALDVLGDEHQTTAALAMNYGNALPDGDDATKVLEHALEISENVHGRDALELVDPLMALADSATTQQEFTNARKHYTRALEIAEDQQERDPFLEAIIGIQLGTTSFSMNRMNDARDYFIGARDKLQPIDNDVARFRLATANFWIGRYEISEGNFLDAIAPLQASVEFLDRFPEARQISVNSHTALVEAYERLGQRDAATPHALFVGQGSESPILLYSPEITNPVLFAQGEVELLIDVDAEGFVTSTRVVKADDIEALTAAAIELMAAYRFAPRFEDGNPVATADMQWAFRGSIRRR